MKQRTVYTQLRAEERMVISSMSLLGESTRAMARVLSPSKLMLEITMRSSARSCV